MTATPARQLRTKGGSETSLTSSELAGGMGEVGERVLGFAHGCMGLRKSCEVASFALAPASLYVVVRLHNCSFSAGSFWWHMFCLSLGSVALVVEEQLQEE